MTGAIEGQKADLILHNGKIATQDVRRSFAQAIAIRDGRVLAVGTDRDAMAWKGAQTRMIDLKKRTVIPGLIDSHMHIIRGGLNFNLELRWDGVPSLADALRRLKEQARRTPPGQWVRVVGGWTEFQFAEKRLPTLAELNEAAPDTPVFVLNLYNMAFLNRAALQAAGYTRETPDPPGGLIERDASGNPTGLLLAKPNASILYSTLARGPKLPPEEQLNSTRQFMREMNRLGVTSIVDAGGGFQRYPDDYGIMSKLHADGLMTTRVAYNLFTQKPKEELADFAAWAKMVRPGEGDEMYRVNGAGEMLVYSAADFEDFLEPRPEMPPNMEADLKAVVRLLAENRWPFRLHATYNETIERALNVFEDVNREVPLQGLHWFFDHAETISERNIERVARLGGGIAVQHRMVYQGEYFVRRYGREAAAQTPPFKRMLQMGIPVGAGTDATRVASYNPWVALYWLTTGRTIGGTQLYGESNRLDRMEALRLWTIGSAWFSTEEEKKGALAPGQLADLAVLSADFFSVSDEQIRNIESVMTIVGGKVVYAAGDFASHGPASLPVLPDWSPVRTYGGYARAAEFQGGRGRRAAPQKGHVHSHPTLRNTGATGHPAERDRFWGSGCSCAVI